MCPCAGGQSHRSFKHRFGEPEVGDETYVGYIVGGQSQFVVDGIGVHHALNNDAAIGFVCVEFHPGFNGPFLKGKAVILWKLE